MSKQSIDLRPQTKAMGLASLSYLSKISKMILMAMYAFVAGMDYTNMMFKS